MKLTVLLMLLVLLAGCGRTIYGNWVQEGKTPQDIKYDGVICYDSLLRQHSNFEHAKDEDIRKLMVECMATKGYRDAPR